MGPAVGPNMALSAAAGDLRAAPPMALRRFRRLTALRRKVHCAAKKKKAAPSGSSEGGSQKVKYPTSCQVLWSLLVVHKHLDSGTVHYCPPFAVKRHKGCTSCFLNCASRD
jgi:hypothetical protein